MEITYRPVRVDDYEQIRQFVIDAGWSRRAEDPERFRRMMEGADRAADRQGRGIGRALVKRLMDVNAPRQITWVLRSARESTGFWEKMGFRKSDVAMEIVRTE